MVFRWNRESSNAALPILVAVLLVCGLGWLAHGVAASRARQEADRAAAQMAASHAGLLASEMQKFRLLPTVLSEYPQARAALQQPRGDAARALNGKLEVLAQRTGAVIYLLERNGITVSASNWRNPDSFVGQNFGFRPYFRDAMRNDHAELFALGSVSRRAGMFIARSISGDEGPLGVIVVKVEFDKLEAEWRRQPGVTFVTDRHGVIIITSRDDWRFHTVAALDAPARAEISRALQFGRMPLTLLGVGRNRAGDTNIDDTAMREATIASAIDGGSLHYLEPLAPALAAARSNARAITLGTGLVAALVVALLMHSWVRRLARDDAWRVLEAEVAVRTAELSDSNAKLRAETQQRRVADEQLRHAQEELARANRLSSLGQITAGVAHEINQPLASIRTIAENASLFLKRGNLSRVVKSLDDVVGMTDRIGTITAELRGFASRGRPELSPIPVDQAVGGSLLMLADRFRSGSVRLLRRGETAGILVVAERVRLEQIVVNLLQNALDAIEHVASPTIEIRVTASADSVEITISDNGPGIDPALLGNAFTPFVTSKPCGLGLGLGIARDIAREFGGRLEYAPSSLGGAAFMVQLKRSVA